MNCNPHSLDVVQPALFTVPAAIEIRPWQEERDAMPVYQGVPLDHIEWLDHGEGDTTVCMTAIGVLETWEGPLTDHLRALFDLGAKLGVHVVTGHALVLGFKQRRPLPLAKETGAF